MAYTALTGVHRYTGRRDDEGVFVMDPQMIFLPGKIIS